MFGSDLNDKAQKAVCWKNKKGLQDFVFFAERKHRVNARAKSICFCEYKRKDAKQLAQQKNKPGNRKTS